MARAFFGKVLELAEWQGLVSSEHFTVDGALIEAWEFQGEGWIEQAARRRGSTRSPN